MKRRLRLVGNRISTLIQSFLEAWFHS